MKLVTYARQDSEPRLGVRVGHRVLDVGAGSRVDGEPLPASMRELLLEGRGAMARVTALSKAAQANAGRFSAGMHEERTLRFLPPVPDCGRCVIVRYANGEPRADEVPPESLVGHDAPVSGASHGTPLPCKPHVAFILSRGGEKLGEDLDWRDHVAGIAFAHAFGGAAALAVGRELVTPDEAGELEELWFTATVNGHERLRRPLAAHFERLPDALAYLTRSGSLAPGDVVALELPDEQLVDIALLPGDVIETSLGRVTSLRTPVIAS